METRIKILSDNRHAGHNYHLLERFEAGIALTGTEVKAAKRRQDSTQGRLCRSARQRGLAAQRPYQPVFARQSRKPRAYSPPQAACCIAQEIDKLLGKTREKGLTLIPTKMYLKNGRIKVEFAVAKGKKLHDKRESERQREMEAEARAAIGRRR